MMTSDAICAYFLQSGIIGKIHPAIVHLPIGIIFITFVLHWYSRFRRREDWESVIRFTLLTAIITIVISIATGYILSDNDEYDSDLLSVHRWSGFLLLGLSIAWYIAIARANKTVQNLFSVFVIINVILAGHYGGSLTHGSDFLSFSSPESVRKRPLITDIQQAVAYRDLIEPVLAERCYGCHGKNKQKGGLRMDSPEWLLKGGENGKVITPGDVSASDLYRRLLLPMNDDDHMPPKPKKPLSKKEIDLIHWWISSGADFDKQVKDLKSSEKEKALLLSYQQRSSEPSVPDTPSQSIPPPDQAAMKHLLEKRIAALPVQNGSHYLQVSFIGAKTINSEDLQALEKLGKNILYLKLSDVAVTDDHLQTIGRLDNLIRLHLDDTQISDSGLKHLTSLKHLRYLNLIGTGITAEGLAELRGLQSLKNLYIYNTKFSPATITKVRNLLTGVSIDTGNQSLASLPTDTAVAR